MFDIDPKIISFFAIPLSYFIVIFSVLLIQWGMVNIIERHIGRISFNHPKLVRAMNWWGVFIHELFICKTKFNKRKNRESGGYPVDYPDVH
ncbi:hypothetical protein ig2599ANME_1936 [groundwater metagenome]